MIIKIYTKGGVNMKNEERLKGLLKNTIQMIIDTVKNDNDYFDNKDNYLEYVENTVNALVEEVK